MADITYNLNGGAWRQDYTPPTSYTPGTALPLPDGSDMTKAVEPADFGGWYRNADFTGGVISTIPASARGNYDLYAKWVRFTPDAGGRPEEIDILTSGIYPYEYDGHSPIRVMFGVKQTQGTVGRPVGTIEVRDANTGEFLYDYTDMQQMNVDNANVKRLRIGRYVFSPHTSTINDATHTPANDDSLLIEYMGDE